jgi:hypothetical protein
MEQPVRRPFQWKGARWVCVSLQGFLGVTSAKAYRLVPVGAFAGEPLSYAQKVVNGDEARIDPNSFYHGMTVTHAGKKHVLCGPPARFEPGVAEQFDLFG